MMIGKIAAYVISTRLDSSPIPNHIRNKVRNPIAGTNLKKLINGSISQLTTLNLPIKSPSGIPMSNALDQPNAIRCRLMLTCSQSFPLPASSFSPRKETSGLGRNEGLVNREAIHHMANIRIHVMIPDRRIPSPNSFAFSFIIISPNLLCPERQPSENLCL